jgi:hypothetical protein
LLNSAKANDVSSVVVTDALPTHVVRLFKILKKIKIDPRAWAPFGFFFLFYIWVKKIDKNKIVEPN